MAEKKKTYYELLRDPRWQRKRLEIMQEVGFECSDCGSSTKTLNIHHSYYEKGLAPWEYPNESLQCLCEDCHEKAQNTYTLIQRQLGKLSAGYADEILGFLFGMDAWDCPMVVIDVYSYEVAMGIGRGFGSPLGVLTAEEILDEVKRKKIDGYKLFEMWKSKTGKQ